MTLRFVVVEDMGMRPRILRDICKVARSATGGPFGELADEDWLMIPPDIAEFGPADLALVDAVFVDFDLQPGRVDGHTGWAPFELRSGATFTPTTGMSVLLKARDLMETPAYVDARRQHVASLSPDEQRWLGASGATRLFSFVNSDEHVSRLFVAAASRWFGATYFKAQPNLASPDNLRDAVTHLRAGADEHLRWDNVAKVFRARGGPALDRLLATDFRGRGQQLIPDPPHEWPSNFDLFRIYLAHKGKYGFGKYEDPAGFRDAVLEICGLRLAPRSVPKASTDSVYFRMQDALEEFHTAIDVNAAKWPAWSGLSRSEDALYQYLLGTQLFWTSDDVRVAHVEHLRRSEQSQ
jgi:hypothetical protein